MKNNSYAYSLTHDAPGWIWRIFDEAGEIVDSGRRRTQRAAEVAARKAINAVSCGLLIVDDDRQASQPGIVF
ncbi:MAG: hypothetical protein ACREDP_24855 [Bradyrhizobium sp.]